MTVFVELCAGSAAVSMTLLGGRAPCRYMGGKGRFARLVLEEMEVNATDVVLVDPGPWGRVWRALCEHKPAVCDALDALERLDHGGLFLRLSKEVPPEDDIEFAVAFFVLQQLNWRSKPVMLKKGKWSTSGLDSTMAYGLPGTDKFGEVRPQLPTVARHLRALDLSRVTAHQCRAEDLTQIGRASCRERV